MADAIAQSRDKKTRYDRQLRLWGEHGQEALENARICILYATAVGTESAKNLVLPGVGAVTIVDPHTVSRRDLGKNFFVDAQSVGKSRAETCAFLLSELNELITVNSVVADPVELIESKPDFFKQFTVVILAQEIPVSSLLKLDALCLANRAALFVTRAYGFLGYLRITTAEHRIYETKPDNFKYDLRVGSPWPELERFALDFPITPDMDQFLYKHVPWLVHAIRELKSWRDTHGAGSVPKDRTEQQAYRTQLRKLYRDMQEENIDQLVENAHYAWAPCKISSDLQAIYSDPKTEIDATSRPFWIVARAVKDFIANEGQGQPPLPGSLPDMVADTKPFVTLQQLFKDKATRDQDAVIARVKALLKSIGRAEDSIKDDYVRLACRNAWFWKLMRYRPLAVEYSAPKQGAFAGALMMDADSGLPNLYVGLRAADRFRDAHGRLPGAGARDADTLAADTAALRSLFDAVAAELGHSGAELQNDKYCQEFVRWGGAELHNIAAFMGGVVAQEVIKIVTEQLVPINNTFIFNGMKSNTGVFDL